MRATFTSRLSYANVMATVAVFLALGGGAYAVGSKFVGGNGAITGCVRKAGGLLQIVKAGKRCPKRTNSLVFASQGPIGPRGETGSPGPPGSAGPQGVAGPTASAYSQNQNGFVYVNSNVDTVAVSLTAGGGKPLTVGFPARLQVTGVVRLRNNTGSGNLDQSGCKPQVAPVGGAFADVGPQMLGLTHGENSFNDEASIPVVGSTDVDPGSYDARIVCVRTYLTGATDQNKFNGDAISVIASAR